MGAAVRMRLVACRGGGTDHFTLGPACNRRLDGVTGNITPSLAARSVSTIWSIATETFDQC